MSSEQFCIQPAASTRERCLLSLNEDPASDDEDEVPEPSVQVEVNNNSEKKYSQHFPSPNSAKDMP